MAPYKNWASGVWAPGVWADDVWSEADTARPSADVTAGSWTPSAGSDLFAMVNDDSDSTYIRSSAGSGDDTCELDFPPMGTPAAGTVTFYIRHRATP